MTRLCRLPFGFVPGRRLLSAGLSVLYALVCSGVPLPTPKKPVGAPFPCAERACGCATAEACWAGACCCYTAREKLAWADAHEFTPPAHFLRAVEREFEEAAAEANDCPHCATKKSCCPTPKLMPVKVGGWLVGLSALKCKGQMAGGLTVLPPALPATPAVAVPHPAVESFARGPARQPIDRPVCPPAPPPRVA